MPNAQFPQSFAIDTGGASIMTGELQRFPNPFPVEKMTSHRCVAFMMRIETQLDIFAVGRHPGKKIAVHCPACFS